MALKKWHHTAKKNVKESRRSGTTTPLSNRSPAHGLSPVHLLHKFRSDLDSPQTSPRIKNLEDERRLSSPPRRFPVEEGSSSHKYRSGEEDEVIEEREREAHVVNVFGDFTFGGAGKNARG